MIYIAAPLACFEHAASLAATLRAHGYVITSRWHDEVTSGSSDPERDEERRAVLDYNLADLDAATVVVAHLAGVTDERRPRATWAEVGYALAKGKRVIWCRGPSAHARMLFDAHELVTTVTSLERVLDAVVVAMEAA